jgi:hypothetical protein
MEKFINAMQIASLQRVRKNGSALIEVPDYFKDDEICLAAVTKYGIALKYVPYDMRNTKICLAAVTNDGNSIQYVPSNVEKYGDICLAAVTNDGNSIQYVPSDVENYYDICLAAVNKNPYNIKFVRTLTFLPDICRVVIRQNGYLLSMIKEYCKDINSKYDEDLYYELCMIGLTESPFVFRSNKIDDIYIKAEHANVDLNVISNYVREKRLRNKWH